MLRTESLQSKTSNSIKLETRFVRLSQILGPDGPLPISRSSFWAGVKQGIYPAPYKISAKVTAWRAEDINELLAAIERRDTWVPKQADVMNKVATTETKPAEVPF